MPRNKRGILTPPEYETGTVGRSIGASDPVNIVQHEVDILLILSLYISIAHSHDEPADLFVLGNTDLTTSSLKPHSNIFILFILP